MKYHQYLTAALLAGSALFFSAGAQAHDAGAFQLAQISSQGTVPGAAPVASVPAPSVSPISNPAPVVTMAPTAPPVTQNVTPPQPSLAPNQNQTQTAPVPQTVVTSAPQTTQVEIHNQQPATTQAAPAPNVNIQMPALNVPAPAASPSVVVKETVTNNHYIYDDTDPNDREKSNTPLYVTLFVLIAIAGASILAYMAYRRRTVIIEEDI